MNVVPFPVERRVRGPLRSEPRVVDRVEPVLVAGLLLTTVVQIGLCVWNWLG